MSVVGDSASGALNGFLSMFGMGSLYNKMGDATSQLQSIKDEVNTLTSTNSLQFATNTVTGLSLLNKLNKTNALQQAQINENTNQFINDSLEKENLFILFCYILLFVLIFFFLIQKKCC